MDRKRTEGSLINNVLTALYVVEAVDDFDCNLTIEPAEPPFSVN